jgi:integrase
METVEAIEENALSKRTRDAYKRCIRSFKSWITLHKPLLLLDSGEIDLNTLGAETVKDYLKSKRDSSCGFSTISQHKAAIKFLYQDQRVTIPSWWEKGTKTFFCGLRRLEALERQTGKRQLVPGKLALEFKVFKEISTLFLKKNDFFSHLYLILTWNLVCRSSETANVTLEHLGWHHDAMTVLFSKTKNDQAGDNLGDPRHVYANPYTPAICPILSLACFLSLRSKSSTLSLFAGESQQSRFYKSFNQMLSQYHTELGVSTHEIGSHSLRKGAASFLAGLVDGPSSISICLRAGWKLGGVQDRYFKYERAGDQFTGRVVAGLDTGAPEFAVLPPSFKELQPVIIEAANRQFPCIRNLNFKLYLLASLIFNANYLNSLLSSDSPLFSSPIFVLGDLKKLKQYVTLLTDMRPTGVPSFIHILSGLAKVQDDIHHLPSILENTLETHESKGGVFITRDFMQRALNETVEKVLQHVDATRSRPEPASSNELFKPYLWGGKFRKLPENYTIPSINLRLGAFLWFTGDAEKNIPPLRRVDASDFSTLHEKKKFGDWMGVFRVIESKASYESTMCIDSYLADIPDLLPKLTICGRKRRLGDIKISSIARILRRKASSEE